MLAIRMKQAWQQYPAGHVFAAGCGMPAAQRQMMVWGGQAEYVGEPVEAPANRMMVAAPAKRGRPSKKRAAK